MGATEGESEAEGLVRRLVRLYEGVDAAGQMQPFGDVLVRVPGAARCLTEPYVPFVGPGYAQGGILLLGTAQNLAQFGKSGDTLNWRISTGLPDAPLHRLYRVGDRTVARILDPAEVSFRHIAMQPVQDGILPALAGLWMAAAGLSAPPKLDVVTGRIAATNFYKHSLGTATGADLNPEEPYFRDRLPAYRDLTLRAFSGPEVGVLQPGAILAFRSVAEQLKDYAPAGCRWATVRDPSWVKQGMGGVARAPGGSWFLRAQARTIPSEVRDLVEGYLGQLAPPYSSGKREAARIYLLVHYLEFRGALG